MPAASMSDLNSCDVNVDPLTVNMVFGTYECWVKICMSASTTDFLSGLRMAIAKRYLEK